MTGPDVAGPLAEWVAIFSGCEKPPDTESVIAAAATAPTAIKASPRRATCADTVRGLRVVVGFPGRAGSLVDINSIMPEYLRFL